MNSHCRIREGLFGRFWISHPSQIPPYLGWSGSRWVTCTEDGLGIKPDDTQVANFDTEEEARNYCREVGLEPIDEARNLSN